MADDTTFDTEEFNADPVTYAAEERSEEFGNAGTALQFPLRNRERYSGEIHFAIKEIIPPNISATEGSLTDDTSASDETTTSIDSVIDAAVDIANLAETFTGIDIEGGSGNNPDQLVSTGNEISLFLPVGLRFSDGVNYENFSPGQFGRAAEAAVNTAAGLGGKSNLADLMTGAANTSVGDLVKSFINQVSLSGITSKDAASAAQIKLTKASPAISNLLRKAYNPNTRILFDSVNLREFSFSFILIPTSADEATAIENIVELFRTELYPETLEVPFGAGGQSIPFGYKYPNLFEISFRHNGNRVAHKLLPCYLTNISTTYNNNGMGFMENSKFTETSISLSFKEYRTLDKQLIGKGY